MLVRFPKFRAREIKVVKQSHKDNLITLFIVAAVISLLMLFRDTETVLECEGDYISRGQTSRTTLTATVAKSGLWTSYWSGVKWAVLIQSKEQEQQLLRAGEKSNEPNIVYFGPEHHPRGTYSRVSKKLKYHFNDEETISFDGKCK